MAPFCRLYVEDALCDAQEGLISPRPWLELDVFCSQSVLKPIDPGCLVVEGGWVGIKVKAFPQWMYF